MKRFLFLWTTLLACALAYPLAAQEQTPIVTIYTSYEADQEGALYFSISGNEEEFELIRIDAGYGLKKANETDESGAFPVKGNIIKVYGPITGITTPNDVTRRVDFAENNSITDVAITLTTLEEQPDLSTCSALSYLSLMSCELKEFDFDKLPKSISSLYILFNDFSSLQVPNLPNLTKLNVGSCPHLSQVDLSKLPQLTELDVSDSPLISSLDLSNNPNLIVLTAFGCGLKTIDLSPCNHIEDVALDGNKLTNITYGLTENIRTLSVSNNKLSSIDVSQMPNLWTLSVAHNPQISTLDLSHTPLLLSLSIDSTAISSIDVKGLKELEFLSLRHCPVSRIDVSGLKALTNLSIEQCYTVTDLKVTGCTSLNSILIAGNKLSFDVTKQMVEDLPTVPFGQIGAFRMADPKEHNHISVESVNLCTEKGFDVRQMDDTGQAIPYDGEVQSIEDPLSTQPQLTAIVSEDIVELQLSSPVTKQQLVIYDLTGRKIFSRVISGDSIRIDKRRLGCGVRLATIDNLQTRFIL